MRTIKKSTQLALAEAIRAKSGRTDAMTTEDMVEAIEGLNITGVTYPLADEPTTMGQMACLVRVRQMRDVVYTPVAELPWGGTNAATTQPAGTAITGIPYSSVRLTDNFIGFNRSLYSWVTALRNPKSDIYTKKSTETAAETWWGVNCSVFVSYVYGWNYHKATAIFPDSDGIEEISLADIQLCDAACYRTGEGTAGHVIIITGIWRDVTGNIVELEVSEATGDRVQATVFTWDDFVNKYFDNGSYVMYRNNYLYKVPYAYGENNDESWELMAAWDGDLSTSLGDKAVLKSTEKITLNPLSTDGYTAIELYRDAVKIAEYSVGDVELSGLKAGRYVAKLVPETGRSSISFEVAQVSATYYGNRYSFTAVAGAPVRIVFKNASGYTEKAVDLTADDVALGYKDIDYSAERACVVFKTEFGFVVTEAMYEEPETEIVLPAEYQQVASLETDGNQYIDTGVLASDYTENITYVFKGNTTGYAQSAGNNYLFGCLDNNRRSGNVSLNTIENLLSLYVGLTSYNIYDASLPAIDSDFVVRANCNSLMSTSSLISMIVDGTAAQRSDDTYQTGNMPDANIYLLWCNGVGSTSKPFCGKLYSFAMDTADGTPIRNFVPCYRVADGVIGLYDTVEGKFYTNAGTGAFTKGADV